MPPSHYYHMSHSLIHSDVVVDFFQWRKQGEGASWFIGCRRGSNSKCSDRAYFLAGIFCESRMEFQSMCWNSLLDTLAQEFFWLKHCMCQVLYVLTLVSSPQRVPTLLHVECHVKLALSEIVRCSKQAIATWEVVLSGLAAPRVTRKIESNTGPYKTHSIALCQAISTS